MSALGSVLPFLAQLRKATPDFVGGGQGIDPDAGMNLGADWGNGAPPPSTPPAGPIASQSPSTLPNAGIPDTQNVPEDKGNILRQPYETKGHALMRILQSGLQGGLNGLAQNAQTYAATGRNAGFGGGFAGAQTFPLGVQRQQLENQQLLQLLPFLRAQQLAGINQKNSEAQKNIAQAGEATAQASAIPVKTQLEQAQTEAAYYKDDPNLGLIDIRTGKPVAGNAGMAPLSAEEAAILGKQPGESVPLKLKNTANEMVNRGIKTVQAGGRSLLVDNKGNTIKDMGAATPMAVINAQMSGSGQLTPEMQQAAGRVASGQVDLATALGPFRRFPGASEAFMNEVFRQNPNFNQATFGTSKDTLKYFTTGAGGQQLTAFRTAIAHAELLKQAAQALNNGDVRTLNGLQNRLTSEFGDPRLTTFDAISNAYNHEVGSVVSKGHITDTEVKAGGATMPNNANLQTITSVANAYQQLMQSKADQLMTQYEQGRKGQPAFPQAKSGPPAGASHAVVVSGHIVGYTSDGKTMTPAP